MDRQQFLQLVNASLAQTASVGREPASCAVTMRQVELQLEPLKQHIAPPDLPLPSAESVAAFIDGNATATEEQHVVSACVHDIGILLQVVSTAEASRQFHVEEADPQLLDRLLALGPKSFADDPATSLPANNSRPSVSLARLDGMPKGPKPRAQRFDRLAAILAVCLLLAFGLALNRLAFHPRKPSANQASSPPVAAPEESNQNPVLANAPPAEESFNVEEEPGPELELESKNATTDTQSLAQQTNETPERNPIQVPEVPEPKPVTQPITQPPVFVSSRPAIAWTEVTGILAQQSESGYDSWVPAKVTPIPKQDDAHDGTWMTPPTCFARGELGGGGQLVMNEQTNLEARAVDGATSITLRFGEIAFRDVPSNTKIEFLDERAAKHKLQVQGLSRFGLRRVIRGLEFTMDEGDVQLGGVHLEPQRTYLLRGGQVEIVEARRQMPTWSQRLPRSSELSNEILTKLSRSANLIQAVDEQLVQFSTNIRNANPQARMRFIGLCRWRASLGVEDPTAVLLHPLWPVRVAAFDMLVSTDSRAPSLAARRSLLGKLSPQHRGSIRSWFEVASGRRQATRQDVAAWLSLLTDDDSDLAAFGDYLLRKSVVSGPDFVPTAAQRVRDSSRKAWAKVVADSVGR